jgi:hypothetical protein
MEVTDSYEMFTTTNKATQHNNLEDNFPIFHCRKILGPQTSSFRSKCLSGQFVLEHTHVSYPCMYVCIRVSHKIQSLHRDLQWSIVLPLLINHLLIPHLKWSVRLCIWGRHSSHLVPWRTGPVTKFCMGYSLTITQDVCGWFILF